MSLNLFHLNIISPEKAIYAGPAQSLIAPCELGYLGVLSNHAPLIANTVGGKVTVRDGSGKTTNLHIKGKGFLEVLKNNVTLLIESTENT